MSAPAPPEGPAAGAGTAWLSAALAGVALLFAVAHVSSKGAPYGWLNGDSAFYFNVSRGLVEHGSLDQGAIHPRSWIEDDLGWNRSLDAAWSNVALGRDGQTWWPKHPWLMPLAAAPLVFAAGEWGALAFDLLFLILVPVFAFRLARQVAPPWAAFGAALLLTGAPILIDHAWSFSNDLFYTVLFLAAFERAFRGRAFTAGLLLGLAVLAKFTLILLAPALALPLLRGRDPRLLFRALAGGAIPVTVLLLANWFMFGGPLTTGYHRILIREAGSVALHSHVADFRWSNLPEALARISRTLLAHWPPYLAALAGVGVLAWRRRWAAAGALFLGLLVPVAFHAPYAYFRTAFVLPSVALTVPAMAALFALRADTPPQGPRRRPRWGRLALVALALLLVTGAVRRLAAKEDDFVSRIREAQVFLGDVPCDYFNNQAHAWECAHHDRGSIPLMTGTARWPAPTFEGRARVMVRLAPHPKGWPRTLAFATGGAGTLELAYGLPDRSRGPVTLRVLAGERELLATEVTAPGLVETKLALPPGAEAVRLEVRGRASAPFHVNGTLVR